MVEEKDFESMSFEDALRRLADIVKKLESQESTLEDSVKLFEEGAVLSRICRRKLEDVEKKLERIESKESKGEASDE